MPVFSPKTTPPPSYNIRSISFPSRSHPTILKIQQNLHNLTSNPPTHSSQTLLPQLSGLGDIYKSVQNLLQLPLTQQSLSQDHKCVADQMLDDLIRFLDVCNTMKECILSIIESVRVLQSSLRRSKVAGGDQTTFENDINAYFFSRKKMKKEAMKFLSSFKKNQTQFGDNHELLSVFKTLREANWVVFSSLLTFLSAPILKRKEWSLMFSRLVGKRSVGCESEEENEMQKVDVAVNRILIDYDQEMEDSSSEKMEYAMRLMESLEMSLEEFEVGLEGLFRELIHTRVALLNIVSNSN
ncbi:hypothetical protein M5689_014175 [Euphorbia peplus]|nr:hypothetical protein M5689_014175 [Euphorbia peplus]